MSWLRTSETEEHETSNCGYSPYPDGLQMKLYLNHQLGLTTLCIPQSNTFYSMNLTETSHRAFIKMYRIVELFTAISERVSMASY